MDLILKPESVYKINRAMGEMNALLVEFGHWEPETRVIYDEAMAVLSCPKCLGWITEHKQNKEACLCGH